VARLFVAVWPPEQLVADLSGLPRKNRPGIRWVEPENLHVTLRFLGEADADEVSAALDEIELEATPVRYGPAIDILFDRVIAVPVTGLDELAAAVASATDGLGTEPPRARFSGHLTVARLKPHARIPNVIGALVAAEDEVTRFELIESRLRPGGPEYEVLEGWSVGI